MTKWDDIFSIVSSVASKGKFELEQWEYSFDGTQMASIATHNLHRKNITFIDMGEKSNVIQSTDCFNIVKQSKGRIAKECKKWGTKRNLVGTTLMGEAWQSMRLSAFSHHLPYTVLYTLRRIGNSIKVHKVITCSCP